MRGAIALTATGIALLVPHGSNNDTRTLMNACVPINTGGGVTQCANPTTQDTALYNCLRSYDDNQSSADFAHYLARCIIKHS